LRIKTDARRDLRGKVKASFGPFFFLCSDSTLTHIRFQLSGTPVETGKTTAERALKIDMLKILKQFAN